MSSSSWAPRWRWGAALCGGRELVDGGELGGGELGGAAQEHVAEEEGAPLDHLPGLDQLDSLGAPDQLFGSLLLMWSAVQLFGSLLLPPDGAVGASTWLSLGIWGRLGFGHLCGAAQIVAVVEVF